MSYPVIILGAGASHDFIRDDFVRSLEVRQFQPPLTDKIFRTNFLNQALELYPELKYLVADAEAEIQHGKTLEEFLSELKADNKLNAEFFALQFYLHQLFQKITDRYYQSSNNYDALVSKIKYSMIKEATVVTFNYDSLFEKALSFPENYNLETYIDNSIKLIKLHGSCDWVYRVIDDWDYITKSYEGNVYKFLVSEGLDPLKTEKEVLINREYTYRRGDRGVYYRPAIAVPLANKEDSFICHHHHIAALRNKLSQTDRILIIGWRGDDSFLINLIKENIKQPVRVFIVSESKDSAKEIFYKKLKPTIPGFSLESTSATFSNFMGSEDCRNFFSYK